MKLNLNKDRFAYVIRLCVLYLMLVLGVSVPLTLSRYTSEAVGEDAGQVAKFDVDMVMTISDDTDIEVSADYLIENAKPGWENEYTLLITNSSDVTVAYDLSLVRPFENLPLEFTLDEKKSGMLLSGASVMLTIQGVWIPTDANQNPKYADEVDMVTFIIRYEQVD